MSEPTVPFLRLLFFGPARECLGASHGEIEADGPLAVEELWARLQARHPRLKPLRATTRLARDGEFLAADALLRPGDEVALIPPVSGG